MPRINCAFQFSLRNIIAGKAAKKGANVVLIQELFETQYFCKDQKEELFELAKPFEDNPTINLMSKVAKDNNVVLPISFFEKAKKFWKNS